MRSFIVATVGMAATVAAQTPGFHSLFSPGRMEAVPACTTFNVQWTPAAAAALAGEVTFNLIGGATQQTLFPIGEKFGSVDGSAGTFAWDVPCDAGADALYGLTVFLVSDPSVFQFSLPFVITPTENPVNTTTTVEVETTTTSPTDVATESETVAPTGDVSTTVSSMYSETTVEAPTNGTVTTSDPTSLVTTITSTTEGASETTGTTETTVPTAGASRLASGSFAILAVAGAFIAL